MKAQTRAKGPGWGTLAAILGLGGAALSKPLADTLMALLSRRLQQQPQQGPGYYSENFQGPTPEGSLMVPGMEQGTTGMVYDPSDRYVTPEQYASRWGWKGGTAPRGDY